MGTIVYGWGLMLGLVLVLLFPSRGLLTIYVVLAAAVVVLGLIGFVNLLAAADDAYTFASEWFQAASHLAGAVMGVAMFAVARDRLATYPASSPEENR